jgi:SAM-dependent methyltransferase
MADSKLEVLPPSVTLQGYDRWSAHYDREPNPMVAATEWALDRQPIEVSGARVVEFGCGTGRHVARLLVAAAKAYVGVDGSPGMLAVARGRHVDPRCAWVEAPLDAVPALGEPFNAALIVLVLEHLAELAPVLAAAARAVRPGGVLRIAEIHPDLVGAGTVAHFQDADGAEVRFTSVAHPVVAVTAALEAAGFAVERAEELAAEGALLERVPRLAKHRGRRVLLDLTARRR